MASIIVGIHPLDGYGDISCGVKVARILSGSGMQVTLATPEEWIKRVKGWVLEEFTVISTEQSRKVENIALRVLAPILYPAYIFNEVIISPIKTIGLYEYGYPNPPITPCMVPHVSTHAMGLADHEIGILIDDDWEWKHSLSKLSMEERFQTLKAHPQWEPVLSEMEKTVEINPKRDLLFLAYSTQYAIRIDFAKQMLDNHKEHENFIFMLPNLKESQTLLTELRDAAPLKSITIRCFTNRLTPDEFQLMMMLSESECLITGDQSLSEAISANKEFQYECRDHKEPLGDALTLRYGPCGAPPLFDIPIHLAASFRKESPSLPFFSPDNQTRYKANFSFVNRKICRKSNCTQRIAAIVHETLSMPAPPPPSWTDLREDPAFVEKLSTPGHYLISSAQIKKLNISIVTLKSSIPSLQHVQFKDTGLDSWQSLLEVTTPR